MRPIFCGNLDYDARQSDLERLFRKYGKVDRVDIKSGFAFIYMDDERDADDAIRSLDRVEFGRKGRRLRVEWTKQERGVRKPGSSKKPSSTARPSKTLFVINFDPYNTRTRDLERHFDPYGKIVNVRIRRNFAFIQYETQEDASRALDATNMSKLMDRVITVEYAIKDDDEKPNGYSPDKSRARSPGRRGYGRERSASPYRRERGSPDYGHRRSPSPYRRERGSPDYGRGPSRSPYRRGRTNSENGHGRSPSPRRDRRPSPDHVREPPSPREEGRISGDRVREPPSPMEEGRISRDREPASPREEGRITPDSDRDRSPSPERRERISPDDYRRGPSPDSKPELLGEDSPKYGRSRSPLQEGYRSRSPVARERSRS